MSPREREAYSLYVLAEAGITRVRLFAGRPGASSVCAEADGSEMTVEDAMALAPIPHDLPGGAACHCAYRPVAETRATTALPTGGRRPPAREA